MGRRPARGQRSTSMADTPAAVALHAAGSSRQLNSAVHACCCWCAHCSRHSADLRDASIYQCEHSLRVLPVLSIAVPQLTILAAAPAEDHAARGTGCVSRSNARRQGT